MTVDPFVGDDVHRQLVASVSQCCSRFERAWHVDAFDRSLWAEIAAIGVFELADDQVGRATDLVAASAELGRRAAYGPIAATLLAGACLGSDDAAAVADGTLIATIASPLDSDRWLVPWGPIADVVLVVDAHAGRLAVAEPTSLDDVVSMSGERWSRGALSIKDWVPVAPTVMARCWLACAAWLVASATSAIGELHEYVHARSQFGRPLSDFQAVSHPIAEAGVTLVAGTAAINRGAELLDLDGSLSAAVASRVAAGPAALNAVYVAHQAYGALGFIEEGPLGMTAMRIRELTSLPPGDADATAWLAAATFDGGIADARTSVGRR